VPENEALHGGLEFKTVALKGSLIMIGGLTETQMAELGSLNNQVLEARSALKKQPRKSRRFS